MNLNKVIIAPDSFKGTISAKRAADIIGLEVNAAFPVCEVVKMPIADGGEGSVETIIAAIGGDFHEKHVLSPDDRRIDACFGIAANGVAILEMAQSSGITRQIGLHPMTSSTYGFGQLILAAFELGAREFILCIGGSATTDGGCGMAAALGAIFTDMESRSFVPCGETLCKIARIDVSDIDIRIRKSRFTVICDVENPLFGENGAAFVYGPQKGANPEQVRLLDEGLRHLGAKFYERFGIDFVNAPGSGAAGGLGAGCVAFLNATLRSGIETILKICDFEKHLDGADLIITGEGRLDEQSFSGKTLSGILRSAKNVPVWSICGVCMCNDELLQKNNLVVFETKEGITAEESMSDPEKYLAAAARKAIGGRINDGAGIDHGA